TVELANAYFAADRLRESVAAARDALRLAEAGGDERVAALAGLAIVSGSVQLEPDQTTSAALAETDRLVSVLAAVGDDRDRGRAIGLRAQILFYLGRTEAANTAVEEAMRPARRGRRGPARGRVDGARRDARRRGRRVRGRPAVATVGPRDPVVPAPEA